MRRGSRKGWEILGFPENLEKALRIRCPVGLPYGLFSIIAQVRFMEKVLGSPYKNKIPLQGSIGYNAIWGTGNSGIIFS